MAKRKEINWSLKEDSSQDYPLKSGAARTSDIEITFTRKGMEISGYYDSFVGLGNTGFISWDELLEYKEELNDKEQTELWDR